MTKRTISLFSLASIIAAVTYVAVAPGGEDRQPAAFTLGGPVADCGTRSGSAGQIRIARDGMAEVEAQIETDLGPYGAAPGSRFSYRFESEQHMELEAQGGHRQAASFLASGGLGMRVLARRGAELIAELGLRDLELRGSRDGRPAARDFNALQGELAGSRTALRMRDDGTHLGLRFDEGLSLEARQWIRSLLSGLQFIVPSEAGGRIWETEEMDVAGLFAVRYEWADPIQGAEPGRLVKRKLRIIELHGLDEDMAETDISGRAEARIGGRLGWIGDASTDEHQSLSIPFLETKTRATRELRFTLVAHDRATPPPEGCVSWDGPWESIDGSAEAEEIARAAELERMAQRYGELRIEDAALALLAAAAGSDQHAIYQARDALLWLVRLKPGDLKTLLPMILAADANGAAILLAAIGGADTAASEAFLGRFVADALLPAQLRRSAVVSLFQMTRPAGATIDSVERVALDSQADPLLRDTSLLLLGTLSRRSPEQIERLLAHEARARRDGKLDIWLEALGNARSGDVLAVAQRYLDHREIGIRNAAVHSLENVHSPEATGVLARQLAGERSMIVRSSLAAALATRSHPAAISAIDRLLLSEANPDVRKSAIQGLSLQNSERARWLLMRTAQQDPSRELRDLAARMLQG